MCLVAEKMLLYNQIAIDTDAGKVTYEGKFVDLHPKEYLLLKLFLQFPNKVLTYDFIIAKLWRLNRVPSYSSVRSHIKGIRKAFRKINPEKDAIETVHGLGYRLSPVDENKSNFSQQERQDNQEYLVIDQQTIIRDLSLGVIDYCQQPSELKIGNKVSLAFPELGGLEIAFHKVIRQEVKEIRLNGILGHQPNGLLNICVTGKKTQHKKQVERAYLLVKFEGYAVATRD